MARIVGVEIPNEKRVEIALTYIHGIGLKTSQTILSATNISPDKRVKDLDDAELKRLYEYIDKNVPTEGNVKQKVFQNIKRLKDIKSYRGLRHKAGLPVRGQNTRGNSRTRKGRSIAVGGLKKVTK
ncbi:30S ribosomal protein S13 [Candidatus Dojkabacteria bacterium]|uniref:Small ribosomal subunit protein uS13 n=1 Tax=Candidatus Dojkabacteria bacterium TaxID=2099670 RepID=A0A955LB81_9BACT|nr:30S ribosomal protein S13 [Candidatus Dojkabacteria bacterium]